ncbi:uncharacterized protein ATC70_003126 [Mucor velutinosus]|uniref:Sterol regulatory element-binding protein cleavage-activating protein n=1 Tax=Mucor velutinosus TaxID=708070 RepID=A0AAN7DD06_9FUNG|nr:hypothetical protein ATC70_003126 [Mucor velutinosus]
MPLLALKRCRSYISKKYFYTFGVKSASHPFYTLFISLISICFLSYPILSSCFTSHHASPAPYIDAHLWQHSAHVQAAPAVPHQPSFVARQIRITDATNDTLSKELLGTSLSIYQALTVSNKLREICATTQHRQCIIHSPLAVWNYNQRAIEQDTDIAQTLNRHLHDLSKPTGLSLHPYATMGRVVLDDKEHFVSANSIILTFILKDTTSTQHIWNDMVQHTMQQFPAVYTHPLHVEPCLLQYKLKLPLSLTSVSPIQLATTLLFSMGLFVIVRTQFSRSTLLKSASGLGIAALFLAVAGYTTTVGIFHYFFRTTIHVVPWFLQLLVCCTATLEHALCLTGAVISKEKGIGIRERLGKGLQQVGVIMTTTLLGELFVLATGSTLNVPNVKAFCLFTSVALVVAYILNLTLFVSVLSIDIKRAELADLGEEEFEKRDHHATSPTRFHGNSGKFKTRRALNAFFLCIVILLLNFLSPNEHQTPKQSLSSPSTTSSMKQWSRISTQFWEALNPTYAVETLKVHAPCVMIVSSTTADESQKQQTINQLTTYYSNNFKALRQLMKQRSQQHSILDSFHPYLLLACSVNIPSIILLFMLVCIIMWMTPWIREQFMLPFLRKAFVRIVTLILRILSSMTPIKTDVWIKKVENEYNEDGMHMGAISMQSRFNMLQNKNKVRNVSIKTLTGMHVADIRDLHASGNLIASIGQQHGKIVLWNKSKGEWIARLDKLKKLGGGLNGWVAAERNILHYRHLMSRQANKKQDIKYLPRARCIQIDQDQRYIAAGFEYGMICVWNADTVHLVRELTVAQHQLDDRVIRLLFIEMDHKDAVPLQQEKCILSVHRNGKLREWNINTGEMTQCVESGHTREITQTLIIPNNQHIDTDTYYIITASKDGTTQCWSRTPGQWAHLYTLTYHNMITSIAAQQLHNGMGILVTGSNDGAVQVWDLDSGTAICTLSKGGAINKKMSTAATAEVGGPLLQFSTVARSTTLDDGTYTAANVSQQQQQQQHLVKSDHSDAVSQVVVTRISNPEFEQDMCPGCHTVINSGFFVASCALDESVHAWRLNRTALSKQEVGCSQCAKDYHRRQQPLYSARTARPPTVGPVSVRLKQRKLHAISNGAMGRMYTSGEESESMCQQQQQQQQQQYEMTLNALFLGKLSQEAGRSLVFCDNMVLAGCRRRRLTHGVDFDDSVGDWEVWFSSLQYYEPPLVEEDAALIPVITYSLEKDDGAFNQQDDIASIQQGKDEGLNLKEQLLLNVFGIKKVRNSSSNTVSRPNAMSRKNVKSELGSAVNAVHFEDIDDTSSSTVTAEDGDDAEQDDDDEEEAYNALPFATIRCIVPINGHGLSCDYGNFIKVVTFSKQDGEEEKEK